MGVDATHGHVSGLIRSTDEATARVPVRCHRNGVSAASVANDRADKDPGGRAERESDRVVAGGDA
jgi:hypothetical protein